MSSAIKTDEEVVKQLADEYGIPVLVRMPSLKFTSEKRWVSLKWLKEQDETLTVYALLRRLEQEAKR